MLGLFLLALTLSQCHGLDLMQTLAADSEESTLVQMMTKAGLDNLLSSGEFTIFAPTNAAFAQRGQLAADSTGLADLLHYHVIQGKIMQSNIVDDMTVTTLAGQKLRLNVYPHNNVVTVNGVPVTDFDLMADNGVIHKVSGVVKPPKGSIMDILMEDSNFSTLVSLIHKHGLTEEFNVDNLTMFAPTNQAFEDMASLHLDKLLELPAMMRQMLLHHSVARTIYSAGMYNRFYPLSRSAFRDHIFIHVKPHQGITVEKRGHVTVTDISATNGVVQVVDHVLIPYTGHTWIYHSLRDSHSD